MTMISASARLCADPFRALVSGLDSEYGKGAGEALAARFAEAEAADFLWHARRRERPLGPYESLEEDEAGELERVAVTGFFGGRWYVAMCLVSPDGAVVDMLRSASFGARSEAELAFQMMR